MSEPNLSSFGTVLLSTAFAILAGLACILLVLAILMHTTKGNLALSTLAIGLFILNVFNLVNVIVWRSGDSIVWWDGKGLCDLEVKLYIGLGQSIIGATASIFRQLATILDVANITPFPLPAQRWQQRIFDAVMMYTLPAFIMGLHYLVQPSRYAISRYTGCRVTWDPSWPSIVLLWIWYPLACSICLFYAFLTIFRLVQHRRQVTAVLQSSHTKTTKSRFLRLLALATVFVMFFSPFAAYFFAFNIKVGIGSDYSWAAIHPPNWTDQISKDNSSDSITIDRWAHVVAGILVFLFFGIRKEAVGCIQRTPEKSFRIWQHLRRR